MIVRLFFLASPALVLLFCVACAPGVTRQQVIETAFSYTQVRWMPEERHVRHGKDGAGQWVHTPDISLARHTGDPKGWWRPGVEAVGMPYMWGGFDTPDTFQRKIRRGHFAGDIASKDKMRLLEDGVSRSATGIDCSGFVSRCWNLPRPYSTRTLHLVSHRLESWDDLRAGDILLNDSHVMIFVRWRVPGVELIVFEAGPYPTWKVGAVSLRSDLLRDTGYAPWRYNHIRD